MYKFGPYGPNHATAGTFAFRKELLQQTRYEEGAALAEEKHFLKNYTIPFVQLDPMKTIVISGHSTNTVDKTLICQNLANHKMVKELDAAKEILDYIPLPILLRMEKIFETYVVIKI